MSGIVPGQIVCAPGTLVINPGRTAQTVHVVNTGDRPIQVGSHYHLAAVNPALELDRHAAWGLRLDIPAGTAVRFEPGIGLEVTAVPIAGARVVPGLRFEWAGRLDEEHSADAG